MKIEKVETFEIRQKGEYGMISNQILQTTLDGLKAITRIDLGICDTEGKVLASTFTDAEESESSILVFVDSPDTSSLRYLTSISLSISCLQREPAMMYIW